MERNSFAERKTMEQSSVRDVHQVISTSSHPIPEENAANLAHAFIGLQDNYDMDHFEARREKILIALVACCPRIAAP